MLLTGFASVHSLCTLYIDDPTACPGKKVEADFRAENKNSRQRVMEKM